MPKKKEEVGEVEVVRVPVVLSVAVFTKLLMAAIKNGMKPVPKSVGAILAAQAERVTGGGGAVKEKPEEEEFEEQEEEVEEEEEQEEEEEEEEEEEKPKPRGRAGSAKKPQGRRR